MKKLLAIALALLTSGCTFTSYRAADGAKFTRVSFGTTQSIGPIEVSASPTSTTLKVEGYSSEQAQIAGAVVSAALKATGR